MLVTPDDALIVDEAGRPVWGVAEHHVRAIVETGALAGFDLDLIEPGKVRRVELKETTFGDVVALGWRAAKVARMYAHLTGRSWSVSTTRGAAYLALAHAQVLVSRGALTSDFLDHIARIGRRGTPGILMAADECSLVGQALSRSAASVMDAADQSRSIVEIHPLLRPEDETPGSAALPHKRTLARIGLGGGASVLSLYTHSDGLDADLGHGLVLCPKDDEWLAAAAAHPRRPGCCSTGWCYRRNRSLEDDRIDEDLIHPASIRARAVILDACIGVLPDDSIIPYELGLGARLLSSSTIGGLITSWRPAITAPSQTEMMVQLLLSGETLGRAVASHNLAAEEEKTGHFLVLFGDPKLRVVKAKATLPTQSRRARLALTIRRSAEQPKPAAVPVWPMRSMLEALSTTAGPVPDEIDVAGEARSALAALDSAADREVDDDAGETGRRARHLVVKVLSHVSRLSEFWLPAADRAHLVMQPKTCDGCSNSVLHYRVDGGIHETDARELAICPRCAFVSDAPLGSNARLFLHRGAVELALDVDGPASAVLTQWCRPPHTTRRWKWPSLSDERLERFFHLPATLPAVPVVLTATIVTRDNFYSCSRAIHGAEVL